MFYLQKVSRFAGGSEFNFVPTDLVNLFCADSIFEALEDLQEVLELLALEKEVMFNQFADSCSLEQV
jgi:hypothetical protein